MPTIKKFENLDCWKEARILVNDVYELTKKTEFRKDFGLRDQIQRLAVSAMTNIAEDSVNTPPKNSSDFLIIRRALVRR